MSEATERLTQGRSKNSYESLICDENPPLNRGCWSGRTTLEKILLFLAVILLIVVIAISASFYGCEKVTVTDSGTNDHGGVCTTKACTQAAGNILNKLDETAEPCDDMVRFSCGKWLDETELPASKSRWGNFDILNTLISTVLRNVMEGNETDAQTVEYMRVMYKGCMDEDTINKTGYDWFLHNIVNNNYGKWPLVVGSENFEDTKFDPAIVAGMSARKFQQSIVIGVEVEKDSKNSARSVIYVDQPSLVLSRTMYVGNDTDTYQKYFDAYKDLTIGLAKLLMRENDNTAIPNDAELVGSWEKLLKIETKIAKMSSPDEERRNETRMYNSVTVKELEETYPNVGFKKFFEQVFDNTDVSTFKGQGNLSDSTTVIVKEPKYFESLNEALQNDTDFLKEDIANYMFLRIARKWVSYGPKEMDNLAFEYRKSIAGTSSRRPRWQTCISVATSDDQGFGMAAGHAYIKEKFDDESRKVASEMVEDIRASFKELVSESPWMDKKTQALAQDKATAMMKLIGYPEWLPNNTALDNYYENVEPPTVDSHLLNVANMAEWRMQWTLNKLDKPTQRDEWYGHPAIVNAWYSPRDNTITFPAGILQGSFFNKDSPKYLNYGSIGVVIGHEITHGFDDQGSQFDKDGNTNPWWSPETVKKFTDHAQCYIDMYGNFSVPELIPPLNETDAHLNGINTQGENIADNGGLREGYRAYKNFLNRKMQGKMEPKLPGLKQYSNEQLFFISFAQTWCEKITKEQLLNQVQSNPHSPGKYRITGPLSNSEDFVRAFDCPVNSAMNRDKKCELW